MTGTIIAFAAWCVMGCVFICMGIYSLFAKKAVGFWANAKVFEVTDIKKYNAAAAKLFCAYGIVFILLGLPLLSGQNSVWIIFSMIGVMAETVAAMVIYTIVIEKKYRKN